MTIKPQLIPCALILAGVLGQPVIAAAPSAETAASKTAREEFQRAEQAAAKKELTAGAFQGELDRLVEQKALWQKQVVYTKSKLAAAQEKLNTLTAPGAQEEIDKWRLDLENWQTQNRIAILELEKVEAEIHDKVQELQNVLRQSTETDVLLPGESIEVFVAEDDAFNGVYQVRRGGYIIMPRVGRVSLAGKDLAGAEQAIKEALGQNQIRDANVMVERPSGGGGEAGAIFLAGEFQHPGAWKAPAGLSPTIVTTILRSGGLTERADLTRVRLLRLVGGQALVEEVNVRAILDGAGLTSDLAVKPGDIVMVPAMAKVVYVMGRVAQPGTVRVLPDDELTVLSAILRRGGFARFANRKKVYVLRDEGNGAKQRIPVNIQEIQDGKGSDLILKSKDIIVVPEKFFSF